MRLKRFLAFVVAFAMVMSVMPAMSLTASAEAVVQTATTCFSYRVNKKTMEDYGMLTNVRGGNQRDGYAVFEIPENLRNASNIDATFTVTRKTEVGGFNSKTVTVKYLLLDDEANTVATDNTSALDYLDGTKTYTDGATISINNNNVNASYTSNTFSFVPNGAKTIIVEIPYNRDTQNSGGEYYGAGVENAPYLTMVASTKVTADYKVGEKTIKTETKSYVDGEEGAVFDAYAYSENGSSVLYKSEQTTLSENGSIVMTAQKNADVLDGATIVTVDDVTYSVVSDNLIPNGDFSEGMTGWYRGNKNGAGLVATTSEFELMGDKTVKTKNNGGTGSGADLYRAWPVEEGKTYYFQVYFGDDRVDPRLSSGDDISVATNASDDSGFVIKHGFEKGLNTVVFTANTAYVWINVAWNQNVTVGNFGLYEVVEAVSITNLAELEAFRDDVNAGNTYAGKTVVLTNDIDLEGSETNLWTPIGTNADAVYFAGTFDGQGHTISNLYVKQGAAYHAAGLFGAVRGTVKNLTIDTAYVESLSSGSATVNGTAVVAGSTAYGATIDDVHVKDATVKGNRYVAGIVGYMDGTVTNCSVENVTIVATPDDLTGSYDNGDKVGGIVGYCNSGSVEITNCELKGNVDITAYRDVAGIVGCANSAVKVNNNTNNATLAITIDTTLLGERDNYNVGEFVGRNTPAETTGNVTTDTASYETNVVKVVTGLEGEGTEEKPYLINNLDDLKWFRDKVDEQAADGSTQFAGKYFLLTDNIDLAGENWNPIGSKSGDHASFKGVFDGGNKTIYNLHVEQAGEGLGLFAYTAGNAEIKNLTLENVTVKSTDNSNYVGGVVGNAYASTKITNVHVKGNIDISGRGYIGGISGHGYVVMDNVSVVGEGTISSTFWCAGGILGYGAEGATNITNAKVEGTGETGLTITSAAGGLGSIVGMAEDNNGTQPIAGSNLSAKNVDIKTYTGAYGDNYANYALGYLYGGNPTSILTGNLTVEDVTITTSNGVEPEVNDAVASIDSAIYFDLQDAIDAAKTGDTVVILRDFATNGTVTLEDDDKITLDLNGHTITYTSTTQGEAMITNKGTLTINDSSEPDTGVINYNYTGAADSLYSKGNYTISNAGTLTVNGGKITIADLRAHAKYPIDNNSTTGDAILVINGGHLYNYNTSAIRQFCNSTTNQNSVTINGGLIEGYCAIWVQNPGSNTVNGSLSITGGEIKTTAAAYVNGSSELKEVASRIYCTIAGDGGAWSENSAVSITGGTINENVSLAAEAPESLTVEGTAVFNGYVELPAPEGLEGSGTEDDPYVISTAGELKWLRDVLNTKAEANGIAKYAQGQYFVLGDDINLDGESWQPIYAFYGVLDGKDYTISNFTCDTGNGNGGLTQFMYGTMKNLTVSDVTATVGAAKMFAPIASTFKGNLDNVHTENITITIAEPGTAENAPSMAGGMIVWDGNQSSGHDGTVKNCSVENLYVTVTNGKYVSVGGFVNVICRNLTEGSYDNNSVKGVKVVIDNATDECQIGGFVAQTETGWNVVALDNCHVSGIDFTVPGTGLMIGGFIANPGAHTTITDSTTEGTIDASSATEGKIGGFVADLGWNNNLGDKGAHQFANCSADVEIITGGAYAGGFIGSTYTVDTEAMDVVFNNCSATNVVELSGYEGGFAGYADRGTYTEAAANEPFFGTTIGVAIVTSADGDMEFRTSLAEALEAAEDGDTVTLLTDISLDEMVTVTGTVTLDLNGYTITGTDNTTANFGLITVNKGNLTVTDSSEAKTGNINLTATNDNGWSRYSAVIANNQGTVTVEGGTLEHLGGTTMAYGIDNLTNGNIGVATLNVAGGVIDSSYIAIRQFGNSDTLENALNVTGGTLKGTNSSVYVQSPNAKANDISTTISDDATVEKRVFVETQGIIDGFTLDISATAVSEIVGNLPEGYEFKVADGKWGMVEVNYVAEVDGVKYESFAEAVADAVDGDVVTLLTDIDLDETVKVTGVVTLDLNGYIITGTDNATASFALIEVQPGAELTICDSSEAKTGAITLFATNNRGWNAYSSVVSNQRGKLTVEGGTIEHLGGTDMAYGIDNLTNGKSTYAETVINGGTVKSTYRAIRQFLNGTEADNILTVNGGTIEGANKSIWMQDPNTNANTGTLTVGEEATLKGDVYLFVTAGSTEWPVEVAIAATALDGESEVLTGNVPEGYELVLTDGVYGVIEVPALPTATVTEITDEELAEGNAPELTFALNFVADEASDEQIAYYSDWYADYVLTINKTATFNADGSADGYLAGQYDNYNTGWLAVPDADVTVNANEGFRIMKYAAEMLEQPGLNITYGDVIGFVNDFDCGIFFDDLFLIENPDLKVTLELRMYNPEDETEYYTIGEVYEFDAPEVEAPALPTATVTELENEDLTFALNFKADDASDEQLAYYGNWYADFELKVDGTVDETITFYTGEGADGYLSGEYGTYGWINVPFNKEVTVNKGETIKIMALAAEIMGEPGLKLTYNDVYTMVKDFNCGVFFTDEFLRANPDAVVTLELRMYNPADETESYVIGETYTFDAPEVADPVAEFDGETFETLQEAIDAVVENGEGTVTLLANSEEDVVIEDYVTVTLVTGDYSYTGEAQLASYGAWIVADEEINAVSTVSDVPVVKGEGNGQYGYVAMAHGVNMVNGAQVRFNSGVDEFGKVATTADKKQGSGIRFVTNVDRNDTLASMADSLDAEVTIDGETYTKGVIGVIISAEGSTSEMIISANSWQTEEIFTSAVTNLAVSNYIRRFTATGFVDVDGIRYRNNTNVTRSIYQVAAGLLKTGNAEVDSDGNHTYDPTDATLIQVLNAYVNQTGIRLVIVDNEHLVPNVATAETGINGAYNSEAYFEVVTSYTEGAKYIAVLDPVGENTEINMNYWNEYVRINNNNSATRGKVEMVKNSDGTYTLTFDAAGTKFEPTGDNEKNDSYDDNYDEAE